MLHPELPANENQRIATLQSLSLLDTPAEEKLDRITRMASNIFDVPIALVSLVDANRQWFKSKVGLDACETSREISFCGHAIAQGELLCIEDAQQDERFVDNPLVTGDPNIRFYAGQPLRHPNGSALGTLCLIDSKPRHFSADDASRLKELAAVTELELLRSSSPTMDDISQLTNKEGFLTLGKFSQAVCKQYNLSMSVAFLHLQGLLAIKYDEQNYHRAVRKIADKFKGHFRGSDLVARYDEFSFVALVPNASKESVSVRLNQVINELNIEFAQSENFSDLQLCAGYASSVPDTSLESLVFDAFASIQI
ncbi:GAF domain-containing protein [Aestuariibacter salexigens]|uniref:GAF domain-containing protein n=1 Tax=Aestuariibacter salexigens TaxID=226010 RepID=UPI0003F7893B|nr:GAF domain-containing protein [Aestuariibacter salexigens]